MKKNMKNNKKNDNNYSYKKIQPIGDRVLIRIKNVKEEEKKNSFGIIIPDTVSQEKPEQGVVVAVGEGKMTDEGTLLPMRVKVGDKVVFSKYGFDEVKIDDEEFLLISENNVLAIIS
jgi:chaperonin GroES